MVSAETALPGRDQTMPVKDTHYVLKSPTTAPFPEGTERIVFGTGCFWGTEKVASRPIPTHPNPLHPASFLPQPFR